MTAPSGSVVWCPLGNAEAKLDSQPAAFKYIFLYAMSSYHHPWRYVNYLAPIRLEGVGATCSDLDLRYHLWILIGLSGDLAWPTRNRGAHLSGLGGAGWGASFCGGSLGTPVSWAGTETIDLDHKWVSRTIGGPSVS